MTGAAVSVLSYQAEAFGILWQADLPLRHFDSAREGCALPSIQVSRCAALAERPVLARRNRGTVHTDGFRFIWGDEVTFDFHAPGRVSYQPGPGWCGHLPDSFFSTVAALASAWIGRLPLHASAIEWRGQGFLLAGKAGSGKSTLASELLGHGARLIGDDLTVLAPEGGRFTVLPGRPAMRLHPASAGALATLSSEEVPEDLRGKLLVRPQARCDLAEVPLAGVILIGGHRGWLSPAQALRLLPPHQFRPRWSEVLPGHGQRRAWLLALAGTIPVAGFPSLASFDDAVRAERLAAATALLDELTA
jgi:hypothetical protein